MKEKSLITSLCKILIMLTDTPQSLYSKLCVTASMCLGMFSFSIFSIGGNSNSNNNNN